MSVVVAALLVGLDVVLSVGVSVVLLLTLVKLSIVTDDVVFGSGPQGKGFAMGICSLPQAQTRYSVPRCVSVAVQLSAMQQPTMRGMMGSRQTHVLFVRVQSSLSLG